MLHIQPTLLHEKKKTKKKTETSRNRTKCHTAYVKP